VTHATSLSIGLIIGILLGIVTLWVRVEECRDSSPTGQCSISVDGGGVKLAEIQWPEPQKP
jgi:hypothetical protein